MDTGMPILPRADGTFPQSVERCLEDSFEVGRDFGSSHGHLRMRRLPFAPPSCHPSWAFIAIYPCLRRCAEDTVDLRPYNQVIRFW